MTTLHCTLKLAKRIPFALVEKPLPSTNKLGDWSANTFNIGRFPCIIITNELTLFTVLVLFKDIHTIWERFLSSLEELLHSVAVPSLSIQTELEEMQLVQFTREANRRTLGSMNDFVHLVRANIYQDPELTLNEMSLRLSEVPCCPLKYAYPREAILKVITTSSQMTVTQKGRT